MLFQPLVRSCLSLNSLETLIKPTLIKWGCGGTKSPTHLIHTHLGFLAECSKPPIHWKFSISTTVVLLQLTLGLSGLHSQASIPETPIMVIHAVNGLRKIKRRFGWAHMWEMLAGRRTRIWEDYYSFFKLGQLSAWESLLSNFVWVFLFLEECDSVFHVVCRHSDGL